MRMWVLGKAECELIGDALAVLKVCTLELRVL